jgi:hypothetical protein
MAKFLAHALVALSGDGWYCGDRHSSAPRLCVHYPKLLSHVFPPNRD